MSGRENSRRGGGADLQPVPRQLAHPRRHVVAPTRAPLRARAAKQLLARRGQPPVPRTARAARREPAHAAHAAHSHAAQPRDPREPARPLPPAGAVAREAKLVEHRARDGVERKRPGRKRAPRVPREQRVRWLGGRRVAELPVLQVLRVDLPSRPVRRPQRAAPGPKRESKATTRDRKARAPFSAGASLLGTLVDFARAVLGERGVEVREAQALVPPVPPV